MAGRVAMPEWRRWAWSLLLLGGGVSIAVNIGHAFLPPPGAGAGWTPGRWAIAWAVIVPLLLFFAVKGLTVIPWPKGAKWVMWRFCAVLPVAGLAGYVSWAHISGLLTSIGEDPLVCILAPFAVDGMMLIGLGGLLIPLGTTTSAHSTATASAAAAPAFVPASAPETGRLFNGTGYASPSRR